MRSSSLIGAFVPKSILAAFAAMMLAGCSSGIERFNQAYNNPSDADPVYTASVPKPAKKLKKPAYVEETYEAVDETVIEETPLKRAAIPARKKTNDYASAYTKPMYKKPLLAAPEEETYSDSYVEPVTAPTKARKYVEEDVAAASPKAVKGKVKVEQGMTMYSIARANGVDVDALAEHNGMSQPYTLMVGQTLRIPGESTPVATKKKRVVIEEDVAAVEAPVAETPKIKAKGVTHTVGNGETLYSLGRKYGVSPFVIADANGMSADQGLTLGQKVKIPGASAKTASRVKPTDEVIAKPEPVEEDIAAAEEAPVKNLKKTRKAPLSLTEEQEEQANADAAGEEAIGEVPKKTAEVKPKVKDVPKAEEKVAEAMPTSPSGLNLRWPVKGKVISNFGNKPNGLKNEGINIAVPEGTDIRAADGGVVAYAGNELKGYGNLVLIRHQGGYVTAYAHAKSLNVKRGDTVKRGDVIAKAGQTGAVSSPQLHFEVRKGATALDPLKYIASATAAN
jgi:murein DD-endopeptidase MepM/ murein hydrolase activator NlpD